MMVDMVDVCGRASMLPALLEWGQNKRAHSGPPGHIRWEGAHVCVLRAHL
jgi:hypothetical protein